MRDGGRLSQAAGTAALLLVMAACVPICGIGAKFSLSNARVDASYTCPLPSTNAPYDVHASIDADNSTTSTVTIKSISEEDVLVDIAGNWNGAKGVKGGGPVKDYSPKSIPSGGTATIKFVMPFECTNSGAGGSTYGDFAFTFTVVTSAGTYKLDAGDKHRLKFAT